MTSKRPIKYFTILGERCSGTTFLQYAILQNFNLQYIPTCGKHFFGHDDTVFQTEKMKETLVICIFRKPVDWIDSFSRCPHHVPPENKQDIHGFLQNEFYSIYELPPQIGQEVMEDRHIVHKRRYHNIFELRETKNDFLLNKIPQLVDHYMMLRYEDLRDKYVETLIDIIHLYKISPKQIPFQRIEKYKGTFTKLFVQLPIWLKQELQEYVLTKVNPEQDARIEHMDLLGNVK